MRTLTVYIVIVLIAIYWLKERAHKYKSTDEIITDVVVATLGGAIGNAVAEIGNSQMVKGSIPNLYGGMDFDE